jgi:membrane protein DedA with SNARE-associated domain
MSALLSPLWLQDLIASYGLWALFAVVMLESSGIPMPGETALLSAALYAATTDRLSILAIILVAAAAAIIGDNCGYAAGRLFGLPFIARHGGRIGLTPTRLKVGQYLFLRHGGKIVFFGRFIALLRTLAALLAGMNRMPWPHFLAMNALGAVAWATLFGGGAYLLGNQIDRVAGPLGFGLLAIAVLGAVIGLAFVRRHENELARRADIALAIHQRKHQASA